MSETKVADKRGQERPKEVFSVYPTCRTCKHFDNFVDVRGVRDNAYTICVIDPPVVTAQIQGVDEEGRVVWATRSEWPFVAATQRCGKHAAKDAN